MASRIKLSGSAADGDYLSANMSGDDSTFELSSIVFYDGAGEVVTPTAGTLTVTGTPNGIVYRTMDHGTVDATLVYDESLRMPVAFGLMTQFKVTLSGIVGADSFSVIAWRE